MIKRKIFLLVVIMTLVVSSCSQGVSSEFEAGAPAKLEIQLGVATTKASGKVTVETADAGITRVTVGVFEGDRVDVITTGTLVDNVIKITATAGARTFIVVANAPIGSFSGIQTKQEFLAKKIALTQDKSLMLMSSALVSTTLTVENKVTVPTQVVRLAARIQLENVKTAFDANGTYSDATFEMDKVFMYNVRGTSTVGDIPTTITAESETSNLIHGVLADKKNSVLTLLDELSSKVVFPSVPSYIVGNHFYVFENSVASTGNDPNATKLVIGGTFKKNKLDLVGTYVYYPIVVNKQQTGTTIKDANGNISTVVGIKRNCRYAINATIKSIGVDSPDKFMNPSDLELGITVTPWGAEIVQDTDL